MRHFIAGVPARLRASAALSIVAVTMMVFGASCEKPVDANAIPDAPGAAIRPEGAQGGKAHEAAECPGMGPGKAGEHCNCHEDAAETDALAAIEDVRVGASPARGPKDAPVTVVVFSDFQCPFCARSERVMADLEARYPGKLRFVFKNNPLPFHSSARLAAKSALAANEQGKFWAYHDVLFAKQGEEGALDPDALEGYASDMGLDVERFRRSMSAGALDAALDADIAEGKRLNVRGTPTFFVNGRRITGSQSISVFQAAIDQVLAAL